MMIEWLAFAGMDHVRIDLVGGHLNAETIGNMIRAAHALDITPFVRVERNNPEQIQAMLGMGALGIIVPEVKGFADVELAVRAAKLPPQGERLIGITGVDGYGVLSPGEYADWAAENIILAVQIETREAVESLDDIASMPGLDMVLGGRGTLSREYGVPGERDHPIVLEIERRIMEKALRAGKITSVTYFPARDPNQLESVKNWIRHGVHCFCLGVDTDIVHLYRNVLRQLSK